MHFKLDCGWSYKSSTKYLVSSIGDPYTKNHLRIEGSFNQKIQTLNPTPNILLADKIIYQAINFGNNLKEYGKHVYHKMYTRATNFGNLIFTLSFIKQITVEYVYNTNTNQQNYRKTI